MSSTNPTSELRELSPDEVSAASGGAIHLHVPGLFHLALSDHGASIGVFGYGVGVGDEGGFTFTFE